MYRRFGARVTIIERGSRLAAHEDEDISAALAEMLVAEGVVVRTDADCVALESDDKGIAVTVDCLQGDRVVRGTHVLIAVGRRPNTDDLGLSRSEEHTSELQSLMLTSYAVFCLKKKRTTTQLNTTQN